MYCLITLKHEKCVECSGAVQQTVLPLVVYILQMCMQGVPVCLFYISLLYQRCPLSTPACASSGRICSTAEFMSACLQELLYGIRRVCLQNLLRTPGRVCLQEPVLHHLSVSACNGFCAAPWCVLLKEPVLHSCVSVTQSTRALGSNWTCLPTRVQPLMLSWWMFESPKKTKQTEKCVFWFHETKEKTSKTDWVSVLFMFKPKIFDVCF